MAWSSLNKQVEQKIERAVLLFYFSTLFSSFFFFLNCATLYLFSLNFNVRINFRPRRALQHLRAGFKGASVDAASRQPPPFSPALFPRPPHYFHPLLYDQHTAKLIFFAIDFFFICLCFRLLDGTRVKVVVGYESTFQ